MTLWLSKLQDNDKKRKALRGCIDFLEDRKDVKRVFQYQGLLYILEIICFKLINCHHNNPLVEQFGIVKIQELVGQKYY